MAEVANIIQLAVDAYHNKVEKYSQGEALDELRKALIVANDGKNYLDVKSLRRGKDAIFSIVEEILSITIPEALSNNPYIDALVDFRNIKLGDKNEFVVKNSDLFIVSEAADGTQAIRRQRIGGAKKKEIEVTVHAVRIYEELDRVLSGAIDFNELIDRVAKSVQQDILESIYALWKNATAADIGGTNFYPTAGTYSEEALIDVISNVEAAANGATAVIVGTKKALRKLTQANVSDEAKSDLYKMGYYGNFNGTPIVCIPQRFKAGTTNFLYEDDMLTIIAGDDKPIKLVYEGEDMIDEASRYANMDLTQEYVYLSRYGAGLVVSSNTGVGKYKMA